MNRANWEPKPSSVICFKHFENKYVISGKRKTLNWKMNPIPTLHTEKACKRPSMLTTPKEPRRPPKQRCFQTDEMKTFLVNDGIEKIELLTEKQAPPNYIYLKTDSYVLYYEVCFDAKSGFPYIGGSIKIDNNLFVKLQFKTCPVPLPTWFAGCKLTKLSLLTNFPPYLKSFNENEEISLIEELRQRQYYQAKGRPPYSSCILRFSLLLRYTSGQAYKLLLSRLPFPSMSLLKKLKEGGLDSLKAAQVLKEKGAISSDVVVICDEMYLRKCVQFSGGELIGRDEEGDLYKGIVVFMIQGLKESIPVVIKACPEKKITGTWLANEFENSISTLASIGFKVRAIVTDNH